MTKLLPLATVPHGRRTRADDYAANLVENIRTRKLAVDRIVPLHGAVAPIADLLKASQ